VTRGEVWWVEVPGAVRRPYLVLTRHAAIDLLHSLIAAPATRTVRDIPTEVGLDRSDGMPETCALSLDNVTLIPKEYFVERICTLGPERLGQVCAALHVAVDC
jgi:mRNA interferase MazF